MSGHYESNDPLETLRRENEIKSDVMNSWGKALLPKKHPPDESPEQIENHRRHMEELDLARRAMQEALPGQKPSIATMIARHDLKEIAVKCFVESSDPLEQILGELLVLRAKKQKDYGTNADPLNNLRGSVALGIPPWVGTLVRMMDKMGRICKFAKEGKLENESVEDSLLDLSNYAMLCLALYREARPKPRLEDTHPNN